MILRTRDSFCQLFGQEVRFATTVQGLPRFKNQYPSFKVRTFVSSLELVRTSSFCIQVCSQRPQWTVEQ
ncbi:hypothetical protein CBS147355_9265 [Penicillium roqueforti]|nr:hypothetical protein CBS147355_9265 [Penicillium roqueforti]KAI2673854.1 hypothetical protein LCP963914a_8928 [Penicillium roqueforti]KAI3246643.1 hypothetical protein CBS147309_8992 [Penicillium roqueforti]